MNLQMNEIHEVLIDMDGVIADFEAGVAMLTGSTIESIQENGRWEEFKKELPGLKHFAMLPAMPLISVLKKYPGCYTICTAAGKTETKSVISQKTEWIKSVIGEGVPILFTERSKHKAQYATPNTLLIDDRTKSLIPFSNAGGKILHYKATEEQDLFIEGILASMEPVWEIKKNDSAKWGTPKF